VPTCVQPSVSRDTHGTQAACAVAPSLPDALADCAPQPARSRRRCSVVEQSAAPTICGTFERRYRLRSRIRTGVRFFHAGRPLPHPPPAPPPNATTSRVGSTHHPWACPTIYFYAMWAEAKEFEGSPPPQPVITPISDSLGGCVIGAVSLGSSCARPRARSAVTIACVAPNVSACGRSVHLGGGDAERAHI